MVASFVHETVLASAAVEGLALNGGDYAIDCTAGGGGHTERMLAAVGSSGFVLALDRDMDAIKYLETKFADDINRGVLKLVHAPFSDIKQAVDAHTSERRPNGILADLGVSSPQLDVGERGFSFQSDGPLDMRMDQQHQTTTAAHLVNSAEPRDLIRILHEFGEEPKARYIVDGIVKARVAGPITTTKQLAQIVSDAVHYRTPSRKHPATKTFQALRMAVNEELHELDRLLADGFDLLATKGRLAVISFHSLEDRAVKRFIQDKAGKGTKDSDFDFEMRRLPITEAERTKLAPVPGTIIRPFPQQPSDEEAARNPRARSARLRIIEKSDLC